MTSREAQAANSLEALRGLHLGRCSRRILLLAPGPTDEPGLLAPDREGRAPAESHRRALRRLAEIGLIELSWKVEEVQTKREKQAKPLLWDQDSGTYQDNPPHQVPVRRSVEKRAARLTPLGAALVNQLRPALESGERIRWDRIVTAVPTRT